MTTTDDVVACAVCGFLVVLGVDAHETDDDDAVFCGDHCPECGPSPGDPIGPWGWREDDTS